MHGRKKKKSVIGLIMLPLIMLIVLCIILVIIKSINSGKDKGSSGMVTVCMLTENVTSDSIVDESTIKRVLVNEEYAPDNIYDVSDTDAYFRIALPKGTILSENMIYKGDVISDDIRIHNFPYVELSDKITQGEYIDIRISFDNGFDYVLLSKKKVQDFSLYDEQNGEENSLWLDVSEEEILRMSGAVVDASLCEGSRIYAIKYKEDYQNAAIVNYPVSAAIEALIENDPNIVKRATDIMSDKLRQELENGLNKGGSSLVGSNDKNNDKDNKDADVNNNYDTSDDSQLSVYEKDEDREIIFFD